MIVLIQILGLLLIITTVIGILKPATLCQLTDSIWASRWGMPFAVLFRLFFGIVLIFAAPETNFPRTMTVLGYLAIIAAALIVIFGHKKLDAFIKWLFKKPPYIVRLWCSIGALFGVFLIYTTL